MLSSSINMSQATELSDPLSGPENPNMGSRPTTKSGRREKSDAKWESYKGEIQQLYVEQGRPLKSVMQVLETKYGFKFSLRSWKAKMKKWNFEKNLPANEMAFIAAKADKRKADECKDTVFFRGGIKIESERIDNFKKRKLTATDMADLPIIVDTPCNMTYHTPTAAGLELGETEAIITHDSSIGQSLHANFELGDEEYHGSAIKDLGAKNYIPNVVNRPGETLDAEQHSTGCIGDKTSGRSDPGSLNPEGGIIMENRNGSYPQVIFNAETIRNFLHGIPARPIALDIFLDLLTQFPTRTHDIDDADSQSTIFNDDSAFSFGDEFFDMNAKFIIDSISSDSNSPADLSVELTTESGVMVVPTARPHRWSLIYSRCFCILGDPIHAMQEAY
ncbi:hypothetical protein ONS95_013753 [Cadophora gregata]|uniref:uncharacterized protein n=1 Tax=Cadophora gregata TaxID=51156 RepID=UPI0026DCADE1|nr:uncharacterized protein ONS95_013753 [Cadophora gregata]KAK0113497.1 hypothetical protein ONS96_014360 [Cadophora gregata f. sp. sojae]KAK0114256.1 hypothetical protein ONS95_013753 [Cadophora gregata]